ncbi:DNA alkylation repair protein [Streptomyces chumphonensis]|uniref:DNA alkylation repair protein n=1 Tax=Streptomyces chumphonensis TaxID=1214925 RepID=A0A927F0G8_9ACTN|nr:DNA alkylation repair protein [Streptomyces chumphonensis]MBD3932873.1 DNA alkylation repair protein [Streptomyces chumphonensis]
MPTADELLDAPTTVRLAAVMLRAGAPSTTALRDCGAGLPDLTFSGRVAAVRDAVLADLPGTYPGFSSVVRAALRDPCFNGWMTFPVAAAVPERALPDGVFEPGLDLLAELTPRLTAEAAVRPFLRCDLHRALRTVLAWTDHADPHVRRLASEGTRPRLPWAPRLPELVTDPRPALPVLDALYRDTSPYVRRSVANHLNDISRDHPHAALDTAERWLADPAPTTASVVRHGLRTLVKAGRPRALLLLGHDPDAAVEVTGPEVRTPEVREGGHLAFGYAVVNTGRTTVRVVVDYVVHHRRADGSLSPKVFKLTTRTLAPGERWSGERRHSFRPLSTRRYHPGPHRVTLQVNGRRHGTADFTLLGPHPA